ncbi:MAG: Class cytochrome family [Blastocatellia bacterium]|nr:Class cytochrome family [Blastocatellia bacterium]
MNVMTILAAVVFSSLLLSSPSQAPIGGAPNAQQKPPETIILAKESKLGQVTFNHADHITKNHSADGTKSVACVECHHTAQPEAEAAKNPPHKMVWPAHRTTTLTAELLEKDSNAPVVNICTDCHARAETKPKLLPSIPQLKFEGSEQATVLNNQQAFHRTCGACHDAVVKARPDLATPPPISKKCMSCHKKVIEKA